MIFNLFFKYLWQQRHIYGFCFIWVVIFVLLFFLTGVPLKYVWYPSLLCMVIYLFFIAADYTAFVRRHCLLMAVKENIDIVLDKLPRPAGVLEEDYQELIRKLADKDHSQILKAATAQKEMMEYVSLWTHQIKTPLTALQLLSEGQKEPLRQEIIKELFELSQYVDMMLQYVRLEGGSRDYVLEPCNVKAMVNQSVKYFARSFISKKISIRIEVDEQARVITDEKWLVFVLKQLLSNALKYSDKGEIFIALCEHDNEKYLSVKDYGIGIASEDIPRIFERGYTGYNGRLDKKATGLGLFLTKRILEQLNHRITIDSEVGKGTTVKVWF